MVGGAVRDLLLRRDAALDIDLAKLTPGPTRSKRLVNQTHPGGGDRAGREVRHDPRPLLAYSY